MAINKGYLQAKTDKASDEVFTPKIAVLPLLQHIRYFCNERFIREDQLTIWCPFDEEDSWFVKVFRENGFKVIATHIDNGQNFFEYEPNEHYDLIISNPPFSIKDDILRRLDELDHPYAMLLPLPALQGQKRFPYLKGCQALIFDKRVNYYKDKEMKEVQKGVSFASIYICRDFLYGDLIFEELNKE